MQCQQCAIIALVALGVGLGCNGKSSDGAGPDKQAYEQCAKEIAPTVALISAYRPYLEQKVPQGKYTAKRRPDMIKASFFASNEIRHAANSAVQKLRSSKSSVSKKLAEELVPTVKACASPDEMDDLKRCDAAVGKLDELLGKLATEAKAAGAAGPPRIGKAAIDDTARASIAPFLRSLGPAKNERLMWEKLKDPKASADDVIAACDIAAVEADGVWRDMEKGDQEIRKVAAIHKLALEAECNQLKTVDGIQRGVAACEKDADTPECKLVCANAKTKLHEGLPAAAFEKLTEQYGEICDKDAG